MAGNREVRAFQVTCPPGVTADAPLVTDLVMPVREVLEIRVRVPSGPNSQMGFQIGSTDTPIIPYNDNTYVVASNADFTWNLPDLINSGSWQAIMYNTGQYPHTIYIYFTVELPDPPTSPTAGALIPAEVLGSDSTATAAPATSLTALGATNGG